MRSPFLLWFWKFPSPISRHVPRPLTRTSQFFHVPAATGSRSNHSQSNYQQENAAAIERKAVIAYSFGSIFAYPILYLTFRFQARGSPRCLQPLVGRSRVFPVRNCAFDGRLPLVTHFMASWPPTGRHRCAGKLVVSPRVMSQASSTSTARTQLGCELSDSALMIKLQLRNSICLSAHEIPHAGLRGTDKAIDWVALVV